MEELPQSDSEKTKLRPLIEQEAPTDRVSPRERDSRRETSSTRIRDIKQFRTQLLPQRSERGPTEALYSKLQQFLARFGKLHDVSTVDEMYGEAIALAGALVDVNFHQVLGRNMSGNYSPLDEHNSADANQESLADEFNDVVKWAMEGKQVLLYDLESDDDQGTAATLCVLPVLSEITHQTAIALYLNDTMDSINVLQVELLQTLQRDLSARAVALLQSERYQRLTTLFDNIVESVPHAIIALGGNDRVMALNSNAEFLFNIQRIFVIDEDYHDCLPESLVETFEEMISGNLLGENTTDKEIELELDGGVTISIGISISLLKDTRGQPLGYLFLCRDMSLSREVQKLRELDQMKSEFVNTVSHELKTPLTAILGGLEVLEDDLHLLPEDASEMIKVVSTGAHRLRDLIFDLLDVSKLEGGKVKLREELKDVREVIDEALMVQQPHPLHTIDVKVDEDVTPIVMDSAKILQCVTNFVSNAIKYSPEGGTVTVFARKDTASRMLFVGVKDQGLGLSPANCEKVWEKFYRVDASYTSQIEGTGLGLVIVRRIVELHGGTTWVESELGNGSTFFLSLPLRSSLE